MPAVKTSICVPAMNVSLVESVASPALANNVPLPSSPASEGLIAQSLLLVPCHHHTPLLPSCLPLCLPPCLSLDLPSLLSNAWALFSHLRPPQATPYHPRTLQVTIGHHATTGHPRPPPSSPSLPPSGHPDMRWWHCLSKVLNEAIATGPRSVPFYPSISPPSADHSVNALHCVTVGR